jgi:hypothetical protein
MVKRSKCVQVLHARHKTNAQYTKHNTTHQTQHTHKHKLLKHKAREHTHTRIRKEEKKHARRQIYLI